MVLVMVVLQVVDWAAYSDTMLAVMAERLAAG
jgi:hypothetical protein